MYFITSSCLDGRLQDERRKRQRTRLRDGNGSRGDGDGSGGLRPPEPVDGITCVASNESGAPAAEPPGSTCDTPTIDGPPRPGEPLFRPAAILENQDPRPANPSIE